MPLKTLPFTREQVERIAQDFPTPFYIYDEAAMRQNARNFYGAFDWIPRGSMPSSDGEDQKGFRNYFAVKATPNPYIVRILREEGMGADCSSDLELYIAQAVGMKGEDVMFTSNDTPASEFVEARRMGAIINIDDKTHIPFLESCAGIPELVCCRYNPGNLRNVQGAFIGKPEEAKYGVRRDQITDAYRELKRKGAKRFGIHTMIASNELNPQVFVDTAGMLFDLVYEIGADAGIDFDFVNLGGGIGIPYKPEQVPVDLATVSQGIREVYEGKVTGRGLKPMRIFMECGRMVTGPFGFVVMRVRHVMSKHKDYVGVDACMADLMRPGMYGAYHHITVLGKEDQPATHKVDVVGSLCENNDKFAVDRMLPEVKPGDLLVIHDTGAHGRAMDFQYNGKLRPGELLLKPDGSIKMARRREKPRDYFATFDFPGSKYGADNKILNRE